MAVELIVPVSKLLSMILAEPEHFIGNSSTLSRLSRENIETSSTVSNLPSSENNPGSEGITLDSGRINPSPLQENARDPKQKNILDPERDAFFDALLNGEDYNDAVQAKFWKELKSNGKVRVHMRVLAGKLAKMAKGDEYNEGQRGL